MSEHPLPAWHSTFTAAADTVAATVHARGVLDLFSTDLLIGAVDVLRIVGRRDVVLDLAGVTAIDHTGVRTLGALQRDFCRRDAHLSILHAGAQVRDALSAGDVDLLDAQRPVSAVTV